MQSAVCARLGCSVICTSSSLSKARSLSILGRAHGASQQAVGAVVVNQLHILGALVPVVKGGREGQGLDSVRVWQRAAYQR